MSIDTMPQYINIIIATMNPITITPMTNPGPRIAMRIGTSMTLKSTPMNTGPTYTIAMTMTTTMKIRRPAGRWIGTNSTLSDLLLLALLPLTC